MSQASSSAKPHRNLLLCAAFLCAHRTVADSIATMLTKVRDLGPGFQGRRVQVDLHEVQTPSGAQFTYEVVKVKDAVAVLAIAPSGNLLVLRQFRYPVGEVLWEVCAGLIDHVDEAPLAAAQRELKEETGFTSERWTSIGTVCPSPGIVTERIHLFIADRLTSGQQELEAAEEGLQVVELPPAEALKMLKDGTIRDLKTVYLLSRFFLDKVASELT